jgi:hypothetical protein
MVIFHSYVSSPEGNPQEFCWVKSQCFAGEITMFCQTALAGFKPRPRSLEDEASGQHFSYLGIFQGEEQRVNSWDIIGDIV